MYKAFFVIEFNLQSAHSETKCFGLYQEETIWKYISEMIKYIRILAVIWYLYCWEHYQNTIISYHLLSYFRQVSCLCSRSRFEKIFTNLGFILNKLSECSCSHWRYKPETLKLWATVCCWALRWSRWYRCLKGW